LVYTHASGFRSRMKMLCHRHLEFSPRSRPVDIHSLRLDMTPTHLCTWILNLCNDHDHGLRLSLSVISAPPYRYPSPTQAVSINISSSSSSSESPASQVLSYFFFPARTYPCILGSIYMDPHRRTRNERLSGFSHLRGNEPQKTYTWNIIINLISR